MEKIVDEGEVKLKIDSADVVSKDLEVFYNPKMGLNRSISILLLKILNNKNMRICLPLAGTGVRAVRMLKELPSELIDKIYVNDLNLKMNDYLKTNLELNKLSDEKLNISNVDARKLFLEDFGFDYIDIDPYGSPNVFLDGAINRISNEGILAVTATDTACLAGTYINTCIRKYWAKPRLCPQKHEIALRILARKVQLLGLQYNKALIPILSYHFEHYYRIFFIVKRGKKECNNLFNEFGECEYDNKTGNFSLGKGIGPMYLGKLQNCDVVGKMFLNSDKISKKLMEKLFFESSFNKAGHYDIHDVCEKNKIPSVSSNDVLSELISRGFSATKVHMNQYGIRTDASIEEFLEIIKMLNGLEK
ncbi:MAG: hypothetical protein AB7V77_02630 [Candidatus Woesearchaeota archaeon]